MQQCKSTVDIDNNNVNNNENSIQSKNVIFKEITLMTPVKILEESYKNLLARNDPKLIGSATACILVFENENNYLYSANLGDSGFVVIFKIKKTKIFNK